VPTKAPTQTPITVDNEIPELAPERVVFSVGDWEGTLVVEIEVTMILLLKSRTGCEDSDIGAGGKKDKPAGHKIRTFGTRRTGACIRTNDELSPRRRWVVCSLRTTDTVGCRAVHNVLTFSIPEMHNGTGVARFEDLQRATWVSGDK